MLKRHDAYKWGPSMYKNKGPVKFEKLVIKIVPEDSSRVAAMMSGKFDVTHQFPAQFITQAKAAPMLAVTEAKPNFQLLYFGFKTTRPMVADRRVREAMSIAINRAEIAKAHPARQRRAGLHHRRQGCARPRSEDGGIVKEDIERAKNCSTKPAGRSVPRASAKRTARNWRQKCTSPPTPIRRGWARRSRAISGRSAIDWRLNPRDSTIAAAKMAEQDYEIWSVTVPYLSAGDLMNIYFDSRNIPTPNRMNWKDAETDEWLKQGRSALTEADRAKFYALVQQKVMKEHLWMPVLNINMDQVANKKIKGARPHMLYQNTFYKGLDVSL